MGSKKRIEGRPGDVVRHAEDEVTDVLAGNRRREELAPRRGGVVRNADPRAELRLKKSAGLFFFCTSVILEVTITVDDLEIAG